MGTHNSLRATVAAGQKWLFPCPIETFDCPLRSIAWEARTTLAWLQMSRQDLQRIQVLTEVLNKPEL